MYLIVVHSVSQTTRVSASDAVARRVSVVSSTPQPMRQRQCEFSVSRPTLATDPVVSIDGTHVTMDVVTMAGVMMIMISTHANNNDDDISSSSSSSNNWLWTGKTHPT